MTTPKNRTIIIGGGPAGLTAALELIRHSEIRPLIIEALDDVGGLSRTIEYKGNRMDIGGHRFFSKSDWVMEWWAEILPIAKRPNEELLDFIPSETDVMLLRSRMSRIFFLRKFFSYPISLSLETMRKLGLLRLVRIGVTYLHASLFPRIPERSLEDFFVNRFGRELYKTFFKDYTQKVWGVPCSNISPTWGAQRIKGLSISKALLHAIKGVLGASRAGIAQKSTNTSLIERFLYPKLGPGQMWQAVKRKIVDAGGEIQHGCIVTGLRINDDKVVSVSWRDTLGNVHEAPCDHVISTMPIRDLVNAVTPAAPSTVREVANGLAYRDFITVGLLLKRFKPQQHEGVANRLGLLPDTWIYIQEPDVQIGRLQIFNNWSPALVGDADTVWLGLEYFCQEDDLLWCLSDEEMSALGVAELTKIGLIEASDVLDSHVVRVPKAYPAYFGTYERFAEIQTWADGISNLHLAGRNGMHRYNNQDHSMLSAKHAAACILDPTLDKRQAWAINIDDEYHEEKPAAK